jgi:hypothetical protein
MAPMRPVLAALALAALALALPAASAAPTDLYLHVLGHHDIPMNTQEPPADHALDLSLGVATSTTSCLPPIPGMGLTSQRFHTYYAIPVPGLVMYGLEEGGPRVDSHVQRGLAGNVTLRAAPVLHWFLSADAAPTGLGSEPAVLPRVVVAGTLRTGSALSAEEDSYERGEVLASGRTAPATLAGAMTEGAAWSRVDGRDVYGFELPLAWTAAPVLSSSDSFNLQVEVFVELPGCDEPGRTLMPNSVAVHTSAGHRPRLQLDAEPTLRIASWRVVENATWTAFVAEISSAWGPYDVAAANAALTVQGPEGPLPLARAYIARPYEHGQELEPVEVAWILDAPMPPGEHEAVLKVHDLQHPDEPVVAAFPLGGPEQPVPGVALPLLALAVAAAAFLARRR